MLGEVERRPVIVELPNGQHIGPMSVQQLIYSLHAELEQQTSLSRLGGCASPEYRSLARLNGFKQQARAALADDAELLRHYGSRADAFYLRFLLLNEHHLHLPGVNTNSAVEMLLNYSRLMQKQRVAGRLQGLGLAELQSAISKTGFFRFPSCRDRDGRHIVLCFPVGCSDKLSDEQRARLYLYVCLKLTTLDGTAWPGFTVLADLTGASLERATALMMANSASKEVISTPNTFPILPSRFVFANAPDWAAGVFDMLVKPFVPQDFVTLAVLGDVTKPAIAASLADLVNGVKLPTPSHEPEGEGWTAGLGQAPGLGAFFEPEMDPAENDLGLAGAC